MALPEIVEQKKLITANELLQLSETSPNHELVKGELIEVTPPGGIHGFVAVEIGAMLRAVVKSQNLGKVMAETGYRLTTNPDTVRSPDISFLAIDKIPDGGIPDGYIAGPPDLAVEIVSPGDKAADIQAKIQDYLIYGTQLVWVIYPQQRLITVYYPDGTAKTLQSADTLEGKPVIPEFSCRVADIFG